MFAPYKTRHFFEHYSHNNLAERTKSFGKPKYFPDCDYQPVSPIGRLGAPRPSSSDS